jgi:hypothetical protein
MEDFVTFEIAKKLKENGFIGNGNIGCCFGFYCEEGLDINIVYDDLDNSELPCNEYLRPSISQVLKWLREEKRIDAGAIWSNNDKVWVGYVNEMDMPDLVSDCVLPHNSYDSYEGASMSAIEYILDNNLIN